MTPFSGPLFSLSVFKLVSDLVWFRGGGFCRDLATLYVCMYHVSLPRLMLKLIYILMYSIIVRRCQVSGLVHHADTV